MNYLQQNKGYEKTNACFNKRNDQFFVNDKKVKLMRKIFPNTLIKMVLAEIQGIMTVIKIQKTMIMRTKT